MRADLPISVDLDLDNQIILYRLYGTFDGFDVSTLLSTVLTPIDEPWKYDAITDLRRFKGNLRVMDVEAMAEDWTNRVGEKDKGRHTAIVADNPETLSRLPLTRSLFPGRIITVVPTLDEALDWIHTQRASKLLSPSLP
ncbi:MAG: hypothetical protein ACK41P_01080 [Asticcacaulis sp.]